LGKANVIIIIRSILKIGRKDTPNSEFRSFAAQIVVCFAPDISFIYRNFYFVYVTYYILYHDIRVYCFQHVQQSDKRKLIDFQFLPMFAPLLIKILKVWLIKLVKTVQLVELVLMNAL
jgi:hypothetical protein